MPQPAAADTLRVMAGIEWKRARWTVLYILSTHGDTHLYEIQRIAQERFGIEVTAYMMRKFRRPHGILHWDYGSRYCSLTDKGRAEVSIKR